MNKSENIQELWGRAAERFGPAPAISTRQGDLSYAGLEARANNLASFLVSSGAAPGTMVALFTEDAVEVIAAIIAALKAGCVFVPLDPRAPERRLAAQMAEVTPGWCVTETKYLPRLPRLFEEAAVRPAVVCADAPAGGAPDTVAGLDFRDLAAHRDGAPVRVPSDPNQMCYVYFTSGSTGRPKAIAGRLKGIDHFVRWEVGTFGIGPGTRVSQFTTPAFDAFLRDAFVPLVAGGTVCVPPGREFILDAAQLVGWIEEQRINLIHCVPSLFRAILNAGPSPSGLPELKHVLMAGEPLLPSDVRRWVEMYGERVRLVNLYGPTETTMTKFFYPVEPADQFRRAIPIGRPMEGARALVVDAKGRACPQGSVGEIYIRTPYRTLGYLNQPELTSEVFVPNPFNDDPNDIVYRTGDLGRVLEDGNFEFLGRRDQQVKIRGVRIELDELNGLLRDHPAVRDAVVVDQEDAGGNKYLCAYLVLDGEARPEVLREHLSKSLPDYMVPSAFVVMDELPRTLSGKVERRALPAPSQLLDQQRGEIVAPTAPVEELLAGMWSQLLGIERIGVNEDFFKLGGHSLLATQLLSRIRAAFGIELSLRSFFEATTVKGLAAHVEAALKSGDVPQAPPMVRAPRGGPLPASFAQQRLWFLQQLEPESPAYNVFDAVRLTGPLNVAAMERTINEIIRRHEALRTTFAEVDGQPVQVIHEAAAAGLPVLDLQGLPEAEREAEAQRLVVAESQRPFDLAAGPLYRACLLRLGAEHHVLLYTLHHIVSDGWSMGVLLKEVSALYGAFARGEESPLEELPVQYADYAVWQREWLQEDVIEEQLAYWRRQLAGAPPLIELPTDRPRPPVRSYRGDTDYFMLPEPLSQKLRELSRRENATLFMTLLAGFGALLARRTSRHDLVLGTDVANRTRPEVEPLIGFFVNQLALRLDLSGDPSFTEMVGRARAVCLGAYAHQEVPFERVVGEVAGARGAGQTPVFQVLFVVQNAPSGAAQLPDLSIAPLDFRYTTSKFDLILQIVETEKGLAGIWRYSTDLFEAETIRGLGRQYETLLRHAAARPDDPLSKLDILTDEERNRQAEEERRREEENLRRFKSLKPKPKALSSDGLVKTEPLSQGTRLPLVVRAAGGGLDLAEWAASERPRLAALLHSHGALLFRGFPVSTPEGFERVAAALCPDLFDGYGDLPRAGEGGRVYGSTPYPAGRAILFHNESSHLDRWPLRIMFCCLRPAARGGETPVVDCRDTLRRLSPRLRERLTAHGLMYVRNFTEGLDVSWQQFYRTESREAVEELCRKASVECEWMPDGGLRTRRVCRAVARHPRTGEEVLFNQVQAHHVSLLEEGVRESLLSLFGEAGLPRNVYYGDGSPISADEVAELVQTYEAGAVDFPWERGDVLLVDNMLVAHGRRPYEGERKIVVAMGEMVSEQDLRDAPAALTNGEAGGANHPLSFDGVARTDALV